MNVTVVDVESLFEFNMNNLVTVTCNEERHMMLLQAESIQKFLAPCNHYVVVNEKNVNVEAWENYLKPYYTNHKLYVIPSQNLYQSPVDIAPYVTQQIYKLEISKVIKDDYLILDTKNFFIKPASLREWEHYLGCGELFSFLGPMDDYNIKANLEWEKTFHIYCEKLMTTPFPDYYSRPITPFKIDYRFWSKHKHQSVYDALLKDKDGNIIPNPSEFVYYSVFLSTVMPKFVCPDSGIIRDNELRKYHTSFYQKNKIDSFFKEILDGTLFDTLEYSNVKVCGLHRKTLTQCGPEHIEQINKYLKRKDFKFQYL